MRIRVEGPRVLFRRMRMLKYLDPMLVKEPTLAPHAEDSPAAKPKKIGFVSLGCPKNLVDSEVMMGLLPNSCDELTPADQDADVTVVNTCNLLERAIQE